MNGSVARRSVSSAPVKKNGRSSNVKVVVRVRPLNDMETARMDARIAVRVMDAHVLVFDPNDESEGIGFVPGRSRGSVPRILQRRARDLRFIFDRVFDEKATNQMVFENTTRSVVESVLNGYNCSVFAYGATGAGKTHTMIGSAQSPGVTFLTMVELYKRIQECQNEKTCDVAVSYLEVYNETIKDLLKPGKELPLREDPTKGVTVSGLTLHQPRNSEELLAMLELGNSNRTQHPTDANASSSRSHAVFQVYVRQKDKIAGLKSDIKLAKMSLIDLAGSERATVTTNRGDRFREGANINKSLLALGNCINALANNEGKSLHIPYRDSKLTRLLKDSLGGNCSTVMIAAVSPSSLSFEDTHNTLKYADRAKNIKSSLVKNVISVNLHVSRYAKIVEELKAEVSDLRGKLYRFESGEATPMRKVFANAYHEAEGERLKSVLQSVYNDRKAIRCEAIDAEAFEQDLHVKLQRKERNLHRGNLICIEGGKIEMIKEKMDRSRSTIKSKQKRIDSTREEIDGRLAKNSEWLERVKSEMTAINSSATLQTLESFNTSQQSAVEISELRQRCKHMEKHMKNQEKDAQSTERLLVRLLSFVRTQYSLLKGTALCTTNIVEEYEAIQNSITGSKEVSWADQSVMEPEGFNCPSQVKSTATPSARTPVRRIASVDTKSSINMTPGRANAGISAMCIGTPVQPMVQNNVYRSQCKDVPSPYIVGGLHNSLTNSAARLTSTSFSNTPGRLASIGDASPMLQQQPPRMTCGTPCMPTTPTPPVFHVTQQQPMSSASSVKKELGMNLQFTGRPSLPMSAGRLGSSGFQAPPQLIPPTAWGVPTSNNPSFSAVNSTSKPTNTSSLGVKRSLDIGPTQNNFTTGVSSGTFKPVAMNVPGNDVPTNKIMKLSHGTGPVGVQQSFSPSTMALCNEFNLQPLPGTPSNTKNNQTSTGINVQGVQPTQMTPGRARPRTAPPLREINANQTQNEGNTTKTQVGKPMRRLPNYASSTISAANKRKANNSMLPRRGVSKENQQHNRSSSVHGNVADVKNKQNKKLGAHMASLRKAMSYANVHEKSLNTSTRTFAPRSNTVISNMTGTRI